LPVARYFLPEIDVSKNQCFLNIQTSWINAQSFTTIENEVLFSLDIELHFSEWVFSFWKTRCVYLKDLISD